LIDQVTSEHKKREGPDCTYVDDTITEAAASKHSEDAMNARDMREGMKEKKARTKA